MALAHPVQPLPLHHADPRPALAPAGRPHLVLIEGGGRRPALVDRRIYLRRRLVVAAAALVVLASLGSIVSSYMGATGTEPIASTYDVAVGESLWSIATTLDLDADRREVVELLADANGGTVIRAGQRLVIPAEVVAMGG
jgi:LysM repeat protein